MIILNRRQTVTLMGSALAMPYIKRARAQEQVLNIYNWADYIGETTIEDFEKATGISVNYDNYASTDGFDYLAAACVFVFDEPTGEAISVQFDLAQGETVVDLNGGAAGQQANDTFRIMGEAALDMNVYGIDSGSDGQPDRYLVVEAGADVLFI